MRSGFGKPSGAIEQSSILAAGFEDLAYNNGRMYGECWAREPGDDDHLRRLADFAENDIAVEEMLESSDASSGKSMYQLAWIAVANPNGFDDSEVSEFWERSFGDLHDPRLKCPNFLRGFVDGAVDFFVTHKD